MAIGVVQEWDRERYWDDLSGKPLIPEMVRKARLEELGNSQNDNAAASTYSEEPALMF